MPKSVETDHFIHHLVHVPLKETPLTDCGGFCGDLDTQIKVEDSVCVILWSYFSCLLTILFPVL